MDLVQQARARAIGESAVGASAQAKRALQRIDAFAHRARIGKRPETIRAFRAAIKMQPRIRMRRQAQKRIRFVVAEQNIESRPQFFDEIVFDEQRFGGAGGGDDFDFEREREHRRSARRGIFLAQMREDAIAQIGGFADIQRAPFAVDKAIHARRTRQPHRRFDGIPARVFLARDGLPIGAMPVNSPHGAIIIVSLRPPAGAENHGKSRADGFVCRDKIRPNHSPMEVTAEIVARGREC